MPYYSNCFYHLTSFCHLMFCTVQDVDKCLSAAHVHDTAPVLNPKPIIFCWCKEHPECSSLFHHTTVVCGEQAVWSVTVPPFNLYGFEMLITNIGTNLPLAYSAGSTRWEERDMLSFSMEVHGLWLVIITRCERLSELGGKMGRLGGGW